MTDAAHIEPGTVDGAAAISSEDSAQSGGPPPTSGESLTVKIGLAVLTFVLGLLASYLSTSVFVAQRQASYSVSYSPLITASADIPPELVDKDLLASAKRAIRIDFALRNTGKLELANVNVLAVLPTGTELVAKHVFTQPNREVPFKEEPQTSPLEIRISSVTLEPQQLVEMTLYVRSNNPASLQTYFSGGGGPVDWVRSASGTGGLSLQENLIETARNVVYALVIPGLIGALPLLAGTLMYGVYRDEKRASRYMTALVGVSGVFANLTKVYFYLRAFTTALPLLRHLY